MTQSPHYMADDTIRSQRHLMEEQAKNYLLSKGWRRVLLMDENYHTSMTGYDPDNYYHLIVFKHRNRTAYFYDDTPVKLEKWDAVRKMVQMARARHSSNPDMKVVNSFLVLFSDGKYRLYTEFMPMPLRLGTITRRDRKGDPNRTEPAYYVPHGPLFPIY